MALELTLETRFLVDARGALAPTDGQGSPLVGRTGYFRLQSTSPDWILLLRNPAQGGVHQKKPRVILAGDCGAFQVADLIAFLGQSRWTGVLKVTAPFGERSLLLKEGDVRSAASDASGDRIGELMVRLGHVNRAALDKVIGEAPPSRIGKALVDRGLIKAHDLYKCLNEQITEIFHGIMVSREGSFALIDQDIDERALTHNLSLSMNGLLMDSIRKIDELAQFRKRIPHGRVYVLLVEGGEAKLEPEEETVLAQIDGRRTLIEIGQLSRFSEFDTTRIVHRLVDLGLATVSSAQAVLATPAPAAEVAPSFVRPLSSPPQPQPSVSLTLSPERVIAVFNMIFREVRDEVAAGGTLDPFLTAANAALKGSGVSTSPVLTGLTFEQDGSLNSDKLLARYEQLATKTKLGTDPIVSLKQALSDVMFFLLFQAGELLESAADEELARRVKLHLSSIEKK